LVDRFNDRVVVHSSELADLIWKRIEAFVKDFEIEIGSPQPTTQSDSPSKKIVLTETASELLGAANGVWKPIRLNERFRICVRSFQC
jgi:hypothetical protein